MGDRTINITDYDSVDLIIRNYTLADIDRHFIAAQEMLGETPTDLKPYWERKVADLELARDIAEWCCENDIPTNDIQSETKTRERGLYALEKCKELEATLQEIRESQKNFQTYILKRVSAARDEF